MRRVPPVRLACPPAPWTAQERSAPPLAGSHLSSRRTGPGALWKRQAEILLAGRRKTIRSRSKRARRRRRKRITRWQRRRASPPPATTEAAHASAHQIDRRSFWASLRSSPNSSRPSPLAEVAAWRWFPDEAELRSCDAGCSPDGKARAEKSSFGVQISAAKPEVAFPIIFSHSKAPPEPAGSAEARFWA